VPDDIADVAAARRNAGDGRDVIGLQRVLHAQQKAQPQDTEHVSPPIVREPTVAVLHGSANSTARRITLV
jgi:hypothetical protein